MQSIKENLIEIKSTIPKNVILIAVSKNKSADDIMEAYHTGHRNFGENRVQELVEKYKALPKDIEWHMIGHLQQNKVKYIAHFIHLIHSIDSLKILKEVNKQAKKHFRVIKCLLQVKITEESTKFGLSFKETKNILALSKTDLLENVAIVGFMGMATHTTNSKIINEEFSSLKKFFDQQKNTYPNLEIMSMGMSGDYLLAIKNGSNMIRLGSSIFGSRNYIS